MHHSRNVSGPVSDLEASTAASSSIHNQPSSRIYPHLGAFLRNPMIRGAVLALFILPGIIWAGVGPSPGQYTVSSNLDSGPDTLRDAINQVNAGANCVGAPCTNIVFAAPMNIFLFTPLPAITASNVFIDGYSAAPGQINTAAFGAALNNTPPISVATGTIGDGLVVAINAANIRIRGLQLRGWNNAIVLNSTGARVEGNWIGRTDPLVDTSGNNIGILVTGSTNTIGGATNDTRNLISGNSTGIQLNGNSNTLATNYIGTQKNGTSAAPNSFFGINVGSTATGNSIGLIGNGNVISGNGSASGDGLLIDGDGNSVLSNRVGTTADGLAALGNNQVGIRLTRLANNNDIGTVAGSGNVVSGNISQGIVVSGDGNRLKFNRVGSDLTGSVPVPNGTEGIAVLSNGNTLESNLISGNSFHGLNVLNPATGNIIQGNTIGVSATFRNIGNGINLASSVTNTLINNNNIGFNFSNGVQVNGGLGGSFGNQIVGNSIHDNGQLGIDLTPPLSAPNPNDATDVDNTEGNRGQNFPVLTSPLNNGSTTTVRVSVDSSGVGTTASILVQIFQADAAAQEGQTFLGAQCFTGNNIVNQPITFAGGTTGSNLVGTATSYTLAGCGTANDGTSEFSAAALIAACPTVTVNPATTLPNGTRGIAYGPANVSATGGTAPYSFSVVAGALPPGLALNSATGELAGIPSVNGSFNFTVRATDANGCFGDRPYTVTIACPGIALSPASLPPGTQGTPYSQTLTAAGGNSPYTFAVTAGTLPPGLALTSAGVLSGTPTASGSSNFTVTATEGSGGCTGPRIYVVVISCPTISIAPAPPNGTAGTPYSHTFTASGGSAPYTFSISSGILPPVLSMSSAGNVTGTPTTAGSYPFTVLATDANGCAGSTPFTLIISCPTITVGGTPPGGTLGTPYSAALTASGGTAPYTFAMSSGSPPPGLTLSPAGTISGTPTALGSFTFSVSATDANGCVASNTFTIVISCPATTISPAILPGGTVATPYNQTLTASGAPGPYVFNISAGGLPPGLTLSSAGTIAGTPATAGSFPFTVVATTSAGCSGSQSYTINVSNLSADLAITKTDGQTTADSGTPISYLITVSNFGPSPVVGATVTDTFPAQFTGVTWSCSATPGSSCPASGSGNINASVNILASGKVTFVASGSTSSAFTGTLSNTAVVNPPGTVSDPNGSNNSATDSTVFNVPTPCPSVPVITSPSPGATNVPPSGTIEFITNNSDTNIVYLGLEGQGCRTELGRTSGNSLAYSGLTAGRTYEARVESSRSGCSTLQSACVRFVVAGAACGPAPVPISPKANDRVTSPTRFEWGSVPGNPEYGLFVGERNETPTLRIRTRETSAVLTNLSPGRIVWFVEAYFPNCPPARSSEVGFEGTCGPGAVPEPSAVGKVTTGEDYEVAWPVQAARYQLEEATNPRFDGATVFDIDAAPNSSIVRVPFKKQVTQLTFFYYRVRALNGCSNQFGPFSYILRVAIEVPVVPVATQPLAHVDVTTPFGSTDKIIQTIFLPGSNAGSADTSFTATTDEPWITVSPTSGAIPPGGVILTVTIDPTGLPVGTNTGTVIITLTSPLSKFVTNGTTRRNLPTSVNLVTPVTPKGKSLPPPNALIIPAVGHTEGVNSKWLSDIRVTNTTGQSIRYLMTFTPSGIDGTQTGKQTEVTILPNVTTAMNDIVNNWYGLGQGTENINGTLEIRPLNSSGKTALDVVSAATVASSRTYNSTPTGTLGQFVPGVPFSSFIGKLNAQGAPAVINMQQITQNAAFRTNMGLVEGSGEPATVQISVFNSAGQRLTEFSHTLKAAEHVQLNGVLSSRNISVNDGRIEVRVTSDTGRVTSYASVIDNRTGDPILIPAVQTDGLSVNKLVIPGVADIDTGVNRWKTDMRLFNAGIASANATLVFYPQDNPEAAKSIQVSVPPGQILVMDDLLQTRFGVNNIGGAVHVNTSTSSALVATARTYDQRPNGTLSLFVPAVKIEEGAGIGDRALQVQQLEQSDRFRSHLGIAEMTGNKVTVEITAVLPNTTASPKFQLELDGNEFTQITQILSRLNIGTAYNARVTVKVISGSGKITAYGSVIDNATHDPTFIPAQ